LALAITVAGVVALAGPADARDAAAQAGQLPALSVEQMPAQAQQVYRQIHRGGPFAYAKDGSVFGNRERLLPARSRGYYREYTVPTPGAPDRGARRIVCGGSQPERPEACYYTGDHYASFARIVP
jgi:ribonuclease T1